MEMRTAREVVPAAEEISTPLLEKDVRIWNIYELEDIRYIARTGSKIYNAIAYSLPAMQDHSFLAILDSGGIRYVNGLYNRTAMQN